MFELGASAERRKGLLALLLTPHVAHFAVRLLVHVCQLKMVALTDVPIRTTCYYAGLTGRSPEEVAH